MAETYTYKVAAINAMGAGPPSNFLEIQAASVPGKPLTPKVIDTTPTSITINWSDEKTID